MNVSMRMMEKIESGEDGVDFVLVFKLSRFGRNAADVLNSTSIPIRVSMVWHHILMITDIPRS